MTLLPVFKFKGLPVCSGGAVDGFGASPRKLYVSALCQTPGFRVRSLPTLEFWSAASFQDSKSKSCQSLLHYIDIDKYVLCTLVEESRWVFVFLQY